MRTSIFDYALIVLMLTLTHNLLSQEDPCGLDNSIVLNPGFEQTNCLPSTLSQMECATDWFQASSSGTTDFIWLPGNGTRPNIGNITSPPNGTNYFVGIQTFLNRVDGPHHEYLGSCISLDNSTEYTFEAYVGSAEGPSVPYGDQEDFVGGFNGDFVIIGITSCNLLPLPGSDCKEDEGFVELARINLSIPPGEWLTNKIHTTFTTSQSFEAIIMGPSCDIIPRSYLLIDDIFIAKGNPCPQTPIYEFDPCCPPLTAGSMKDLFIYNSTGTITSPYNMVFTPNSVFQNQMQAYIDYLYSLNNSIDGLYFTWRLMDMGVGTYPLTNYFGNGQIGNDVFNNFLPGGSSMNGGSFFSHQLVINHWYKIHVGMYLNNGIEYFSKECSDDTWFTFNFKVENQRLIGTVFDQNGKLLKTTKSEAGRNGKVSTKN